ncbi:MAG: hypothetical protein H6573_02670 [Lewinellaceae bacterium]|nr:hypothetical protein [Lewinellaceae bacterium]
MLKLELRLRKYATGGNSLKRKVPAWQFNFNYYAAHRLRFYLYWAEPHTVAPASTGFANDNMSTALMPWAAQYSFTLCPLS